MASAHRFCTAASFCKSHRCTDQLCQQACLDGVLYPARHWRGCGPQEDEAAAQESVQAPGASGAEGETQAAAAPAGEVPVLEATEELPQQVRGAVLLMVHLFGQFCAVGCALLSRRAAYCNAQLKDLPCMLNAATIARAESCRI